MSRDILLSLIDPDPAQPRKHFDQTALDELAQSMHANGLAVPILVRPAGDRFVIVHGERRYRAAGALGWETIPAEVRDVSPDDAQWLALIENIQRADLSPIEEARAYQAHLEAGITQQALGQRIGKSQSHIATKLRFLKLSDELQAALDAGIITEGHAKQLLRIDDTELREAVYHLIRIQGLSVAHTAETISRALAPTTDYHALVQTTGSVLARAREFAVWSAAVRQGCTQELDRARAIIEAPDATPADMAWAVRTAGKWQQAAGEIHVRALREMGQLLEPVSEEVRQKLATSEAGLDTAFHQLHNHMVRVRDTLCAARECLAPTQFEQWIMAALKLDAQTAHDFMAYAGPPGVGLTERMLNHIVTSLELKYVT